MGLKQKCQGAGYPKGCGLTGGSGGFEISEIYDHHFRISVGETSVWTKKWASEGQADSLTTGFAHCRAHQAGIASQSCYEAQALPDAVQIEAMNRMSAIHLMFAKPHKKICFHRIVAHDILSFAKLSSCEMC